MFFSFYKPVSRISVDHTLTAFWLKGEVLTNPWPPSVMALQFFVEGVSTKLEQESLPDLVQIWAQFHSLLPTKSIIFSRGWN